MSVICVVGALGPVRFADIESTMGNVSTSTLSARLEELTAEEILVRKQYDEIPPRVEYELTPDGARLCDVLEPVLDWVESRNASP